MLVDFSLVEAVSAIKTFLKSINSLTSTNTYNTSTICGSGLNGKHSKYFLFVFIPIMLSLPQLAYCSNSNNLSTVFLVDCKSIDNYGLHSYYLFARQPVFDAHTAALKQTEFLLRKISKAKKLTTKSPKTEQHNFYIPVSFQPQSWVQHPGDNDFSAAARWLLHNYDYQCASKILNQFPNTSDSGPYLLSSLKNIQLIQPGSLTSPQINPNRRIPWRTSVLIQNISNTDSAKSISWLDMFFKKSWQPRKWQTMDILNLHESLAERLWQNDKQLKEDAMLQQSEQNNIESISPITTPLQALPAQPKPFHPEDQFPVRVFPAAAPNPYLEMITIQFRLKNNSAK